MNSLLRKQLRDACTELTHLSARQMTLDSNINKYESDDGELDDDSAQKLKKANTLETQDLAVDIVVKIKEMKVLRRILATENPTDNIEDQSLIIQFYNAVTKLTFEGIKADYTYRTVSRNKVTNAKTSKDPEKIFVLPYAFTESIKYRNSDFLDLFSEALKVCETFERNRNLESLKSFYEASANTILDYITEANARNSVTIQSKKLSNGTTIQMLPEDFVGLSSVITKKLPTTYSLEYRNHHPVWDLSAFDKGYSSEPTSFGAAASSGAAAAAGYSSSARAAAANYSSSAAAAAAATPSSTAPIVTTSHSKVVVDFYKQFENITPEQRNILFKKNINLLKNEAVNLVNFFKSRIPNPENFAHRVKEIENTLRLISLLLSTMPWKKDTEDKQNAYQNIHDIYEILDIINFTFLPVTINLPFRETFDAQRFSEARESLEQREASAGVNRRFHAQFKSAFKDTVTRHDPEGDIDLNLLQLAKTLVTICNKFNSNNNTSALTDMSEMHSAGAAAAADSNSLMDDLHLSFTSTQAGAATQTAHSSAHNLQHARSINRTRLPQLTTQTDDSDEDEANVSPESATTTHFRASASQMRSSSGTSHPGRSSTASGASSSHAAAAALIEDNGEQEEALRTAKLKPIAHESPEDPSTQLSTEKMIELANLAIKIHDALIDPFSSDTMEDPVILVETNKVYDRTTLKNWIESPDNINRTCTRDIKISSHLTIPCLVSLKLRKALGYPTAVIPLPNYLLHTQLLDIVKLLPRKFGIEKFYKCAQIKCPKISPSEFKKTHIYNPDIIRAFYEVCEELNASAYFKKITTEIPSMAPSFGASNSPAAAAADAVSSSSAAAVSDKAITPLPEILDKILGSGKALMENSAEFPMVDRLTPDERKSLVKRLIDFHNEAQLLLLSPTGDVLSDPVRDTDGTIIDRNEMEDPRAINYLPCYQTIYLLNTFGHKNKAPKHSEQSNIESLPDLITPTQMRLIAKTLGMTQEVFSLQITQITRTPITVNVLFRSKGATKKSTIIKAIFTLCLKNFISEAKFREMTTEVLSSVADVVPASSAAAAASVQPASSATSAAFQPLTFAQPASSAAALAAASANPFMSDVASPSLAAPAPHRHRKRSRHAAPHSIFQTFYLNASSVAPGSGGAAAGTTAVNHSPFQTQHAPMSMPSASSSSYPGWSLNSLMYGASEEHSHRSPFLHGFEPQGSAMYPHQCQRPQPLAPLPLSCAFIPSSLSFEEARATYFSEQERHLAQNTSIAMAAAQGWARLSSVLPAPTSTALNLRSYAGQHMPNSEISDTNASHSTVGMAAAQGASHVPSPSSSAAPAAFSGAATAQNPFGNNPFGSHSLLGAALEPHSSGAHASSSMSFGQPHIPNYAFGTRTPLGMAEQGGSTFSSPVLSSQRAAASSSMAHQPSYHRHSIFGESALAAAAGQSSLHNMSQPGLHHHASNAMQLPEAAAASSTQVSQSDAFAAAQSAFNTSPPLGSLFGLRSPSPLGLGMGMGIGNPFNLQTDESDDMFSFLSSL